MTASWLRSGPVSGKPAGQRDATLTTGSCCLASQQDSAPSPGPTSNERLHSFVRMSERGATTLQLDLDTRVTHSV